MTKYSITVGMDPHNEVRHFAHLAKVAEAAGFDAIYLWDTWFAGDAYVGLTAAALNTDKILLGPGVAPVGVRQPVMLVNAMGSLDNVSNGRGVLTLGSGGMATAGRLTGFPVMSSFRESVDEIRRLNNGETIEFGDRKYQAEALGRPLPLNIAAWGPKMLEAAGELADGVFLMGPEQKSNFSDKIERVRSAAAAVGRNPADVKIALTVTCVFGDDSDTIIDSFKTLAIHYMHRTRYLSEYPEHFLPTFEKIRALNAAVPYPEGGQVSGQELVTDEMVKYMLIVGTKAEVRERLQELMTLDVDEVTFQLNYASVEQIQNLGELIQEIS